MRFRLWLVWKYLKSGRSFLSLHILLSIFAMSLGVACLIVAMAIVSGYESTLRNALVDSFGHLVLLKRGEPVKDLRKLMEAVAADSDKVVASTPFLLVEAIAAKSGQLQGVLVEGIDPQTHEKVVQLGRHLISGSLDLSKTESGALPVAIGKVLRDRLAVNLGDEIRLVVPVSERFGGDKFRPRSTKLKVVGVLDMGRYDFDERYIVIDLAKLQKFAKLDGAATGLRIRLQSHTQADAVAAILQQKLGYDYMTKTWFESNRNLFEAIDYEKPVIFFIVCLIVVAAGFSVAGSLYVSVLRRFRDISVLKTMGADSGTIRAVFTYQGILVGFLGSLAGLILGVIVCYGLTEIQSTIQLFPGDVYRIDKVALELRAFDVSCIFIVSIVVCFLSGLAPAAKGSRLSAVEGLRYE